MTRERDISGQDYGESLRLLDRDIVDLQIPTTDVGLYERAAGMSGFSVRIVATAGETYKGTRVYPDRIGRTREGYLEFGAGEVEQIKVGENRTAVYIEKPKGSKGDHSPFWSRLEELRGRFASG